MLQKHLFLRKLTSVTLGAKKFYVCSIGRQGFVMDDVRAPPLLNIFNPKSRRHGEDCQSTVRSRTPYSLLRDFIESWKEFLDVPMHAFDDAWCNQHRSRDLRHAANLPPRNANSMSKGTVRTCQRQRTTTTILLLAGCHSLPHLNN